MPRNRGFRTHSCHLCFSHVPYDSSCAAEGRAQLRRWCDVLPAFRLGEKLEDPLAMYLSDLYTASVNLAGLPAMSVPLGTDGAGLPVGGQLIGPDFSEESVCRAGVVIEHRAPAVP